VQLSVNAISEMNYTVADIC